MDTQLREHVTKRFEITELKMLSDFEHGGFEGYATVFNHIDLDGDVILPGAFKDVLTSFVRDGFAALSHNWSELPIGTVEEAFEDERGLFVRIHFHSDARSQAVRNNIAERMERGKTASMSIGFFLTFDGVEFRDDGVRVIKQVAELVEVSIVTLPAQPLALVSAVKGQAPSERPVMLLTLRPDVEMDEQDAAHIKQHIQEQTGYEALLLSGVQAVQLVQRAAQADADDLSILVTVPPGVSGEQAEQYAELLRQESGSSVEVVLPEEQVELDATNEPSAADAGEGEPGLRFADESDAALAAVTRFIERAASLAETRASAGRQLSERNLERLRKHKRALGELASALDALLVEEDAGLEPDVGAGRDRDLALHRSRARLLALEAVG